jgi:large subunit ribosomal protein L1
MGKIKTRTIGNEELENKQKQQAKQKAAEKKFVKGGKGGECIVSVGPSEEELARLSVPGSQLSGSSQSVNQSTGKLKTEKLKAENRKRKTDNRKASRSKSYQKVMAALDKSKKYKLMDALGVLEKLQRSKFDETVELHINTIETGISGNITLPHGTGKQIRVAIADDELLTKVAAGKIDFDVLLADPTMMPKLARVARILGPKGLMPNPKNATLVKDPVKTAENFKKGQVNFKTELKAPIIHLMVGKISFGAKKLSENISTLIEAIKKEKIRNVTLKSTMSPGIKLEI